MSHKDIKDADVMTITWRRLNVFLKNEDGEKPVIIGDRVEKESEVWIRHDDMSKSFALGQPVRISTQEFAEVCWSLWLFGEDLAGKIKAAGLAHGFLKDTA